MKGRMANCSSLQAALSADGNLCAVSVPSSDRRIIQIYQIENGLLQTTLTAKNSSNIRGSSSLEKDSFDRILFCGNNHVVALSKADPDFSFTSGQVLIWDLSRGGVVAHSIADESHHKQYLDAANTAEHLYLLVAISRNNGRRSSDSGMGNDSDEGRHANKLQVHQYDPNTGRLIRKIKCGKFLESNCSEFGLAVHRTPSGETQLFVRSSRTSHHEAFRVLDAETGNKVGKHKYSNDKKQTNKDGAGGNGIVIASPYVALPRISSVALYNLETQKWIPSIPTSSASPQVQLCTGTDENKSSACLLLVDQELFKCTPNSVESLSRIHSDQVVALLPRSLHQVAVVLFNPKSIKTSLQVQLVDWGTDDPTDSDGIGRFQTEVSVHWQSPGNSSGTTEEGSVVGKRRNAERMTVLGAGQAGGESSAVSERKSRKKYRQETGDNEDGIRVAGDPSLKNMTIADRLKQLTEIVDTKPGEDEDSSVEDAAGSKGKGDRSSNFVAKRATTESLTKLLTQGLQGGDDGLLELALTVRDRSILQETFKGLDSVSIEILLTKLTTRLASKPQRAEDLALWLSFVLQCGRVRNPSQLQSLKNLLQERIEVFPHLLRLEGRLSMVKSESKSGSSGKKLAAT